jgi:pyruvate kinase
MVQNADDELKKRGVIRPGDVMAIVAGTQSTSGSTNFIRLHRVRETSLSPDAPAQSTSTKSPEKKTSRNKA